MPGGPVSRAVQDALASACDETGIPAAGAHLLHVHSNTVFFLPASNVVARISGGPDGVERIAASLRATRWLSDQGFPTVRPKVNRVVTLDGIVVSFWEYEETVPADRSMPALARLLRTLHTYGEVGVDLPQIGNPVYGTAQAVRDFPEAFDGDDRNWLSDELRVCERRWEAMRFVLPTGLVHGDAHPNNVLYTRRGALLGDWDHVGYGPPEWDLVQAIYFHRRFPTPSDDLDAAARIYGWDLREWSEVDTLVGIGEISGLGSYIRTAAANPGTRAELAYRIKTLREHDTQAPWNSPSHF